MKKNKMVTVYDLRMRIANTIYDARMNDNGEIEIFIRDSPAKIAVVRGETVTDAHSKLIKHIANKRIHE